MRASAGSRAVGGNTTSLLDCRERHGEVSRQKTGTGADTHSVGSIQYTFKKAGGAEASYLQGITEHIDTHSELPLRSIF